MQGIEFLPVRRYLAPIAATPGAVHVQLRVGLRLAAFVLSVVTALCCLALQSWMPAAVLPPTAAVLAFRQARKRRWTAQDAQRDAVAALCGALRAELEAGLQPRAAFTSAVWSRPELRDLAERTSLPDPALDLPAFLTAQAAKPGRAALRSLAACWYAADRHGVALSDAIAGIEEGLRAECARQRAAAVELAGIRATILLLATLPVFGFTLGLGLGADPLDTLLHRGIGRLCLAFGLALDLAGLLWTDRLAESLRPDASTSHRTPRRNS